MFEVINKILRVFSDNGLFEEGVELIGSWCFHLYQKHLGAKSFPLRTQDIDFLIPNPYRGKEHKGFIKQLEDLGFSCDFNSNGSLYLWSADFKIEFITPLKGHGLERSIKIKAFGFNAIPLRFVDLLLVQPINIIDNGVKVKIPNPSNFCLHKLIIASRRSKIDKSLKDLQQAICTSVIVNAEEIKELFNSLPKKWRNAVLRMLEKSKKELPLLLEEIAKLEFTLQDIKK
ncbi:MAG: GSU2403 family nucleotidyltransferase fold protein [Candidatus Omnitrophota bacterium]|nr:GSU2403 family nucleotidyltransferase fold protein [Candidatus Omnitrophota bacterium]